MRTASTIAAAWMLSLGFDLLLHGGLLARLYAEPAPFLLPPDEAFRRIPFGYAAFLGLTLGLFWLLRRLDVRGAAAGFSHGAAVGAIVWGALALGLYSITTITVPVLVAWGIGQAVELGLAGSVFGAVSNGSTLRRVWAIVGGAIVLCLAATILLQSLGFAPPMRVVR